jgi:phage-related tail fiber protein
MTIVLDGTNGITAPQINAGNIVGQICFFAMSTAPAGFLKCNGAAISRTTYADLFAVIGTTYGAGNGSTTFTLPDARGEFLRCWDDGRGVDSGRGFGTNQNATRVYRDNAIPGIGYGGSLLDVDQVAAADFEGAIETLNYANQTREAGTLIGGLNAAVTGIRVRPRNLAFLACIKF